MVYDPRRPLKEPFPDDDLVSLIMFYDSASGVARLSSHRRMRRKITTDLAADSWRGAYRLHRDGRGYTFEYAVEWETAAIVPPKQGETRANNWNIHFSDGDGVVCTGQIVENLAEDIPKKYIRFQ